MTSQEAAAKQEEAKTYMSHSRIYTYLQCPHKYYLNYILEVPVETVPDALVFGSHIHYAVAEYYRHWQKNGSQMPLNGLQEAFIEGWREDPAEIAWKKGNSRDGLQERALAMLEIFHGARGEPGEIIAVESKFRVPLVDMETGEVLDYDLVGVVDLVEKDETGDVVLVELKTSARAYSTGQIGCSHQPSIYAYGLWELGLVEPGEATKIRYDVLTKTKQPKFQQLTTTRIQRDVQRTINLIKEISRAISHEIWYRNTSWWCGDCQFRDVCE